MAYGLKASSCHPLSTPVIAPSPLCTSYLKPQTRPHHKSLEISMLWGKPYIFFIFKPQTHLSNTYVHPNIPACNWKLMSVSVA